MDVSFSSVGLTALPTVVPHSSHPIQSASVQYSSPFSASHRVPFQSSVESDQHADQYSREHFGLDDAKLRQDQLHERRSTCEMWLVLLGLQVVIDSSAGDEQWAWEVMASSPEDGNRDFFCQLFDYIRSWPGLYRSFGVDGSVVYRNE